MLAALQNIVGAQARADRSSAVRRRARRAAQALSGKGARAGAAGLDRGSRGRRRLLQRRARRHRAAGRQHRPRRRADSGFDRRGDHRLDPAPARDPRGRRRQQRDDLRSRASPRRSAGRSARRRSSVSAVARVRGHMHDRRQHLDQRWRPQRHRLWQYARPRDRRRSGARRRAHRQRASASCARTTPATT